MQGDVQPLEYKASHQILLIKILEAQEKSVYLF
jgi:hypothetical protein